MGSAPDVARDHLGDSRPVDVHVRRLREEVEADPASPLS